MVTQTEEQLRFTLVLVNEWLRFAEAKNALLVALASGAFYAASTLALRDQALPGLALVYVWQAMIQAPFAVAAALLSFLPRLRLPGLAPLSRPAESDNLLYFQHIAKYEPGELVARVAEKRGDEVNETVSLDVSHQAVANARIALIKLRWFTLGAWFMVSAFLTPVVAIVLFMTREESEGGAADR